MNKILLLSLVLFGYLTHFAQNATDIFLADISINETYAIIGNIKNISNHAGYDNQPNLISNSKILFSSIRDGKQSDIYEYDINTDKLTPFTSSDESEYSPTLSLDGKSVICVKVEKDEKQRLWSYNIKKKVPKIYLPNVDSVGYFTQLNKYNLAIFALGEPQTLRWVDVKTQQEKIIDKQIGRTLYVNPINNQLYYVDKSIDNKWILKCLKAEEIIPIIEMPTNTEDFCITNDGLILSFSNNKLLGFYPGESRSWFVLAVLDEFSGKKITRLAINKTSTKLAFVVSE
ncbi:MAG: TolB family protein [Bacteroidia bacterium]